MTRAQRTERDEAIAQLREWIKPGDTVYTILDHVSRSGMVRAIRVVIPMVRREVDDGGHWRELGRDELAGDRATRETVEHLHPNYAIGKALGLRHWKRNGREQDALIMGGCGMDMGFALVYHLSETLYGHSAGGYACLGKGKCPSNYHVNYRSTVDCPGLDGKRCYAPSSWGRYKAPENWPRRLVEVEGELIEAGYLACQFAEDGDSPAGVCPTCQGAGSLPNPEGEQRYDLVHTDGYAIRHRWL